MKKIAKCCCSCGKGTSFVLFICQCTSTLCTNCAVLQLEDNIMSAVDVCIYCPVCKAPAPNLEFEILFEYVPRYENRYNIDVNKFSMIFPEMEILHRRRQTVVDPVGNFAIAPNVLSTDLRFWRQKCGKDGRPEINFETIFVSITLSQWFPNFFSARSTSKILVVRKHKQSICIVVRCPLEQISRTSYGPRSRLWESLHQAISKN